MARAVLPAAELAARIVEGEPTAIARGISSCERGGDHAEELLEALPERSGYLVGITGSPGAGKSTLVNAIAQAYRETGVRVGVIAVDPSSPITGGALLGDRIRLDVSGPDPGLFFRSLASRGASGGLSDAARDAARVLSAGGFELLLMESIGAGQAEVRIMSVADTVVVVLIPGAGDDMQAMKAGMMEIADVFVLNKADQPGIEALRDHVRAALHLRPPTGWSPPVVETVANQYGGISELLGAIASHHDYLLAGAGASRATAASHHEARRRARSLFEVAMSVDDRAVLSRLDAGELTEVAAGRELARLAAARLTAARGSDA
jgi:LAO/AO transport system kinase